MEYRKRLRILDDFIDKCNGYIEDINSSSMWEESYIIESTEDRWKIFKNDVNAYLKLNGDEERKKQFLVLTTGFKLNRRVFLDLIVFFNQHQFTTFINEILVAQSVVLKHS